jgi:hypothetical protein
LRRLITNITKLQLLHNKNIQVLTIINERYYKKIYEIHKIQINKINQSLYVRIQRYLKHDDHSHKAKHAPITIGPLFNGNHKALKIQQDDASKWDALSLVE